MSVRFDPTWVTSACLTAYRAVVAVLVLHLALACGTQTQTGSGDPFGNGPSDPVASKIPAPLPTSEGSEANSNHQAGSETTASTHRSGDRESSEPLEGMRTPLAASTPVVPAPAPQIKPDIKPDIDPNKKIPHAKKLVRIGKAKNPTSPPNHLELTFSIEFSQGFLKEDSLPDLEKLLSRVRPNSQVLGLPLELHLTLLEGKSNKADPNATPTQATPSLAEILWLVARAQELEASVVIEADVDHGNLEDLRNVLVQAESKRAGIDGLILVGKNAKLLEAWRQAFGPLIFAPSRAPFKMKEKDAKSCAGFFLDALEQAAARAVHVTLSAGQLHTHTCFEGVLAARTQLTSEAVPLIVNSDLKELPDVRGMGFDLGQNRLAIFAHQADKEENFEVQWEGLPESSKSVTLTAHSLTLFRD